MLFVAPSVRFAGAVFANDGHGGTAAGPTLALGPGPLTVQVDWGAPNALTGDPRLQAYSVAGDVYLASWFYDDGAYVIHAGPTRFGVVVAVDSTTGASISGKARGDLLVGGFAVDTLQGGAGDDIIIGDGKATPKGAGGSPVVPPDPGDLLYGGKGNDLVSGGYGIEATNETLRGGDGNDTLSSGMGNDDLRGGAGDDVLTGGGDGPATQDDDDRLAGGAGADSLVGGAGRDTILCGQDTDVDTVVYYRQTDFGDVIRDFVPGTDKVQLYWSPIAAGSPAPDAAHWAQTPDEMSNTDPWLIYAAASGRLLLDLDGTGPGASLLIARFSEHPALGFDDLILIG